MGLQDHGRLSGNLTLGGHEYIEGSTNGAVRESLDCCGRVVMWEPWAAEQLVK